MASVQSSLSQHQLSKSFLLSQTVMTLTAAADTWQVLVLNVEGRVLTPDQMRAGLYVLPSEAALATSLLQGGAWTPPHISQQTVADEPAGELATPLRDCPLDAEHASLILPCVVVLTTVLVEHGCFCVDAQASRSVACRLLCLALKFQVLHRNSLKCESVPNVSPFSHKDANIHHLHHPPTTNFSSKQQSIFIVPHMATTAFLAQLCSSNAADDVRQSSAILQDMVADVINGSDVAIALAGLLEEETPTVADLRHGSRLAQAAVPMPTDHQTVYDSPTGSIKAGAAEGFQTMGSSTDRHGDPTTTEEDNADTSGDAGDAVIDKVFQQVEFQAFAEFVLDSACFSLLQESAAGRWQAPDDSMT